MTYEELVGSVEAAAEQKNREILERANREAEEIIREAEEKAALIKAEFLKESLHRAEAERNRLTHLTNEEIKASLSHIKEDLFSQAFLVASADLKDIRRSPGYPELFKRLLEEAIREAGNEKHVLHISGQDQNICKTISSDYPISSIQVDLETAGGLSLSSSDGKIIVSNTMESRIERAKDIYKLEIYTELTGD